mmetsp:Transcript_36520/g.36114  ORF Transcript_36520/g.36114 Transcript_36520/m.36114 type:complete len:266 (-) Transcript_36520:1-798(-)
MNNTTKNYTAQFYPVSGKNNEEVEPDDITYKEMIQWLFNDSTGWETIAQEYIESFQIDDDIDRLLKNPKKRFFTFNKYEDIRAYKRESDRIREFPCKMHSFYAKFSKYDIRRVKSLCITLNFRLTGFTRTFIYSFDEFLDFYGQEEGLCEDALVESIKDFYSNTDNLSSYFRILTIDTSKCSTQRHNTKKSVECTIGNAHCSITFPHIEDYDYEKNQEFTKVKVKDYRSLFGKLCGVQSNILTDMENYIPPTNWRERLGELYFPY